MTDLLVIKNGNEINVLELTVGFETNLENNSTNKENRYENLLQSLTGKYEKVTFINLSMSALGIYGKSCGNFKSTLIDIGLAEPEAKYIFEKSIKICIRTSYFIFCSRNKEWTDPDLLEW